MRSGTFVLTAAFVAAIAGSAGAQTDPPLTPLQVAIGCASRPSLDLPPADALRVIGGQDTVPKRVFGARDLIVVAGGTQAGVQLGQQFFIRRSSRAVMDGYGSGRSSTTMGWIRVVAVNDTTAIGTVERACGGIIAGDFLEPFAPIVVPPDADRDVTTGEPDFAALGRVVIASEGHLSAGLGDFVLIDRGADQGVGAGTRFAIYRDLRVGGMPLASVGEGIVISTSESMALTRITRARDAVIPGDYIAVRK